MIVKIKKLDEKAIIPGYAKPGDAGMDFVAISKKVENTFVEYGTGLAIEIPEGYVCLLFPRGSVSKYNLSLANCVGVLDSGYRGEIIFRFKQILDMSHVEINADFLEYEIGDKIGQMIILPYPQIELQLVDELSETERGEGGWGSSGK